jgi:hypothetical protein
MNAKRNLIQIWLQKTKFLARAILVLGIAPLHLTAVAQTLGEALNATNLTWIVAGNAPWIAQTNVAHDGLAAAQSGAISGSQSSIVQTTITGPCTLAFWWKISSQPQGSSLTLIDNGTTLATFWGYGSLGWQPQTNYLGSGDHVVQWSWLNSGAPTNTAWLDQVSIASGATAPIITSQPARLFQAPGLGVTFNVTALGTPPLTYQWQFNGTNIPAATNASFGFTNVLCDNFGDYRVSVSNIANVVVSSNATLWRSRIAAWGNNYGGYGENAAPPGLTNALNIAAGESHSMLLKTDGTVVSWGGNYLGQTNVPLGLADVVAIAAGGYTSLALKSDGTVAAWGNLPQVPSDLMDVVAIAGGCGNGLALKADGTVIGWGDPLVPSGLSNVVAIAAGCNHCLAVKADGTVAAWGANYYGMATVPPGLSNVVAAAAGDYDSAALRADGSVFAWGGAYGGSNDPTNVPPGLSNVVTIASGGSFYIALKADGTIVMWGWVPSAAAYLTNVTAISGGGGFCLSLVGDDPPTLHAPFANPSFSANVFNVSLPTQSGHVYRLEYSDSLTDTNWVSFPLIAGNGRTLLLTDSTATNNSGRFYRVRRW